LPGTISDYMNRLFDVGKTSIIEELVQCSGMISNRTGMRANYRSIQHLGTANCAGASVLDDD
jgi:hypothetical protein